MRRIMRVFMIFGLKEIFICISSFLEFLIFPIDRFTIVLCSHFIFYPTMTNNDFYKLNFLIILIDKTVTSLSLLLKEGKKKRKRHEHVLMVPSGHPAIYHHHINV